MLDVGTNVGKLEGPVEGDAEGFADNVEILVGITVGDKLVKVSDAKLDVGTTLGILNVGDTLGTLNVGKALGTVVAFDVAPLAKAVINNIPLDQENDFYTTTCLMKEKSQKFSKESFSFLTAAAFCK